MMTTDEEALVFLYTLSASEHMFWRFEQKLSLRIHIISRDGQVYYKDRG